MGRKFAVAGSNLVVSHTRKLDVCITSTIISTRFRRNFFRFLEDVFHKWLDNFDIEPFYSMINNLDPDLKFIFENPSKSSNFLVINIQIVENNLVFYIHCNPTNSFNYLTYTNLNPQHTKNNILLPLAKRIVV